MAARSNPTKARFFPEEVPEAISITPSASGVSIASYAAFSPYVMSLKRLWSSQTSGTTLRIDIDSGHAVLESPLEARTPRLPSDIDLIAQDSMDLWALGTTISYFAFTSRVTKPTIFEKIKNSMALTDDEKALAEEFDIKRKHMAGILSGSSIPQFKKIYEIAKKVTVTAAGNTRVGRLVNVKKGEKAVLLGIHIDSRHTGLDADETYFTVNRDVVDTSYVKLDCRAMPVFDTAAGDYLYYEIPCYIPALDRLEILIESTPAITDFPVYYRYGVANLTLIEKIRWEQTMTADEKKTADEFDLFDSVKAGVL